MKPNPFKILEGHANITSINSALTPWLIAEFGINYADWDNVDTATHMLTHVITSLQLGGYTERTFSAAIEGHRVEQVAFTKMILRTLGKCHVPLLFNVTCRNSDTTHVLSGKSHICHRKDMRIGVIKLLCRPRNAIDRAEIVALQTIGITDLSTVVLSRKRLPFLEELCDVKGVVGEPVIFQTSEDKEARKASVLGEGVTDAEKALYWILGEFSCH